MSKFKVCLTGGIASGKTFVSDRLGVLGMHIIDADILAREVVSEGSAGLAQLVEAFGCEILDSVESLDRKKLRQMVFGNQHKLKTLNSIIHPLIKTAINQSSYLNSSTPEVWVIPLLDELSEYSGFDRIITIDTSEDIQLTRVMQRDQVSSKNAQAIISSQPSRRDRLKLASDVIVNNKSFVNLKRNVDQLFNSFNIQSS